MRELRGPGRGCTSGTQLAYTEAFTNLPHYFDVNTSFLVFRFQCLSLGIRVRAFMAFEKLNLVGERDGQHLPKQHTLGWG